MQPWQEVADVASLPGSCHNTSSSLCFHENDLSEQTDTCVGSFDNEQLHLATVPVNMCADDYWYGLWHCEPIANENVVDALDESPLHLFEGFLETKMESHTNAPSSACGSSSHTCETSAAIIHNKSSAVSFIHPSPVFSEGSSLAGDQPCINNHPCAQPHVMNAHTYMETVNSVETSFPWALGYDNEYTTNSNNCASATATSFDDDLLDSDVSTLAPLASPPSYELNVGGDPSLNSAARAISEEQYHLEQSNHQRGAMRSGRAQESQEYSVAFLVVGGTTTIEDGYVWRKYGQKKIKYKIHPRSYFRCAQPNCSVKKQTESSSDICGSALITYFGKHNHPL